MSVKAPASNNPLHEQISSGLKDAGHIKRLNSKDYTALKDIGTWLVAWIKQGADSSEVKSRMEAVQEFVDPAKGIFLAQIEDTGVQQYSAAKLTQSATKLLASVQESLNFYGSIDPVHHARVNILDANKQGDELADIEKVLAEFLQDGALKLSAESRDPALMKGEFLEAIAEAKNGDESLIETLAKRSSSFTREFLQEQQKIFDVDAKTEQIQTKIVSGKTGALISSLLTQMAGNEVKLDSLAQELSEIDDLRPVAKELGRFYSESAKAITENANEAADLITQTNFEKLSPEAQKLALYTATRGTKIKNETNGQKDFMTLLSGFTKNVKTDDLLSIATTMIMGYFGGSFMGMPGMGVIMTSVLALIGRAEENSTKVELKSPEQKITNERQRAAA